MQIFAFRILLDYIVCMKKREQLIKSLKEAGCKLTSTRLSMLEVFSRAGKPISTESILSKTKDIDVATVYRNLISLQKVGLIRRVELHKNADYYELHTSHHHHIICRSCGIFEDFKLCHIRDISKKTLLHSTKFSSISDHSLEFYGMCKVCAK